jgi:hypothetical protein
LEEKDANVMTSKTMLKNCVTLVVLGMCIFGFTIINAVDTDDCKYSEQTTRLQGLFGQAGRKQLLSSTPMPVVTDTPAPTATPDVTPTSTPFSPTPTPAANTIYVPYHYPTIQLALDAANNGDTILVAPGEYTGNGNVNLKFRGKAVHLTSFPDKAMPVINCDGSENDHCRAFLFMRDDGPEVRVSNIAIVNGFHYESGAGMRFLPGSAPIIDNVLIEDCHSMSFGGAVHAEASGVMLNRVRIINCSAVYGGGGASFQGSHPTLSPTVYKTEFIDNTSQYPESGGGAAVLYWSEPVFTSCVFRGNQNAALLFNSDTSSSFQVNNSLFVDNQGAVKVLMGNATIDTCTFSGNSDYAVLGDPARSIIHLNRVCMWGEQDIGVNIALAEFSNIPFIPGAEMHRCFHSDPIFVEGPWGSHYVFQSGKNFPMSPNINTGGPPVWMISFPGPGYPVYLDNMTTCPEHEPDTRFADIGYHYTIGDQEPTPRPPPERPVIEDVLGSTDEYKNDSQMTFLITAKVDPPAPGVEIDMVELYWENFPTPWRLYDDGTHGDRVAGDGRYSRLLTFAGAQLPEYDFTMYVVATGVNGEIGTKMPYIIAVESGYRAQQEGPELSERYVWYEPVTPGSDETGFLWILAKVEHSQGLEHIDEVRLMFDGADTGIRLLDIGSQADLGEGDGYFGVIIVYNGLQIPEPGEITLDVVAVDREGHHSTEWPIAWKTRSFYD